MNGYLGAMSCVWIERALGEENLGEMTIRDWKPKLACL